MSEPKSPVRPVLPAVVEDSQLIALLQAERTRTAVPFTASFLSQRITKSERVPRPTRIALIPDSPFVLESIGERVGRDVVIDYIFYRLSSREGTYSYYILHLSCCRYSTFL